jgi:tripartite-type tricarboxylate transporter receptor subunit TctC
MFVFGNRLLTTSMGLAAAAALIFTPLHSAQAQSYPSKPIKMIEPFPAGGTTDIVARLVAQRMSESMGQPVLVENKGGASGAIGADAVAKAAPDGYTILMHNISFPLSSVAQTLAETSPYNVDTDFAGISIAVYVPFVWTAHPNVPAKDRRGVATLLQGNKTLQCNYGSTGPGFAMHVLGMPSLELEGWNGLFAPAKTPKDIIERLQREVAAAVRHPDLAKRLAELGADPVGSSPAEQDAMLRRQLDQFRAVIREMKIE